LTLTFKLVRARDQTRLPCEFGTNPFSTTPPQPFYGPVSGTIQVSRCQKRTSETLRCKGRLIEADTPTIRLGTTPSGLSSAHLHHPPCFLQAGCPSSHPTNSVKICSAVPEIFHKQTKKSQRALKTEPYAVHCVQ